MKAKYRKNPTYPNNPFIEALPPQLGNTELMTVITQIPKVPPAVRELSTQTRLSYASKVLETYLPLDYAPHIYNMLYQGIIGSYVNKNTVEQVRQSTRIYEAIQQGKVPNTNTYATQAASGSILGVPGIGKTSTIIRILGTIPQVIEHERYGGESFFCKQINWIRMECPNDCSVKACCVEIFSQIDKLLGTSYAPKGQAGRGQTVDMMIARLSQLCLTHHIGVLVIDEIQNVVTMNKKGGFDSRLIRFFVQLMNDTGISVVLVGTPEVGAFFDRQPHLARRTRGPRIAALEYGDVFIRLLEVLWEQQSTQIYEPLSDALKGLLYEISGGIPALLAQIIHFAQQYAITSGSERLSEQVLKETAKLYRLRKSSSAQAGTSASSFRTAVDGVENGPAIGNHHKGRPKVFREPDDITVMFAESPMTILRQLQKRGWVHEI